MIFNRFSVKKQWSNFAAEFLLEIAKEDTPPGVEKVISSEKTSTPPTLPPSPKETDTLRASLIKMMREENGWIGGWAEPNGFGP